jgi:uncharacterized protein involved in exopolysaccharide biosynthesis
MKRPADDHDAAPVPFGADPPEQVPVSHAVAVMIRRKWLILLIMILVSAPAAMFIFSMPRVYDAQALLMVDSRRTEFSDLQAIVANVTSDTMTVHTQIDTLSSPEVAGRVVDQLHLVDTPDVQKILHPDPSLAHRMLAAVSARLGWEPAAAGPPPTPAQERQIAIGWLTDRVTIVNDGRSYTVSVRARTHDPELSAAIANAYVDRYLEFTRELKIQALAHANSWLDEQLAPLQDRVRRAKEAVELYREKHGLVLGQAAGAAGKPQGQTIADQQLSQINAQLIVAIRDLAEKQSHLRQAQAALRGAGSVEAVPEVVASPLIQQLREQQAELAGRAASLGQSALAKNPALQSIQASVDDLNRRIGVEIGKIVASLQGQVSSAQATVDALQRSLSRSQSQVTGESQADVSLEQLVSEADAAETVYRDYLGRYEQTSSQAALQEPDANQLSRAEPPLGPSGTQRNRLLALVVAGSAILGAVVALAAERLRGGVRTAEQLDAETGMFPLGFVPLAEDRNRRRLESRESIYTGSVNHVHSMLRFGDNRYRAQVVLVTSAVAGEGKTFFSVSLAASVGRNGGRALLIDADLRRPQVANSIGAKHDDGLLADGSVSATQRAIVRREALPGVDVLTFAHRGSGGRLLPLGPGELDALIKEGRARYDLIVVDAPPVLAIPDAPVLASVVDGAIMVVRWRHTPTSAVKAALRLLQAYRVRVIGGVVTQVQLKELSGTEGGYGHLYSGSPGYFA